VTTPILRLGDLGDIPLVMVTDYALAGPSTATVGVASDQFVVTLGAGTLGSTVNITPSDGAAPGSFSVTFVTLSDGSRFAVFTYTATAAGTITISVTNNGGLTDPAPLTLTVSAASTPEEITHGPIVMLRPAALWKPGGWK
jgi:hypothetical protein